MPVLIRLFLFSFILLLGKNIDAQEDMLQETEAFELMKGKLPCPAPSGELDRGRLYLESDLKTSAGMDVYSQSDSVLAVHDGILVSAIPTGKLGYNVIVSHGAFFTVYTGLESVNVESKETISAGQLIGRSASSDKKGYKFHIEIWKNTEKLFPGDWISCK